MNRKRVRIKVPSSSANLGPGYDVLGVALNLYNELEVTIEKKRGAEVRIAIQGEGADSLPKNKQNIIWQSAKKVFDIYRLPLTDYRFFLTLNNRIPLARGLGSSAAARLSGILAANALCKNFLSNNQILELAVSLEGHPDNLVPSLLGGLCISCMEKKQVQYIRLELPRNVSAVVCVPSFELSTKKARAVLPKQIPHQDAVYNVSRVSLLLGALMSGNYSLLKNAMRDKLHQTYRKKLVPGFDQVLEKGYKAGALGICLSGAGPSIFAFVPKSKAAFVGNSMKKGFEKVGQNAKSFVLEFNSKGAEILYQ